MLYNKRPNEEVVVASNDWIVLQRKVTDYNLDEVVRPSDAINREQYKELCQAAEEEGVYLLTLVEVVPEGLEWLSQDFHIGKIRPDTKQGQWINEWYQGIKE